MKIFKKFTIYNVQFTISLLSIVLICILHTIYSIPYTFAQSFDELDRELKEKQDQIKQAEEKLAQTRDQKKTLESQLSYIDGQISLTELKIDQAQFQIIKLQKEIGD